MITVQAALQRGQSTLFYAEVETPLLDATVLLGEALGLSKEQLLACPEAPVQEEGWRRFQEFLDRRCRGIPVSYIRRKKEFFGLEFYVDERVLVPRPDTEALVEEALRLLDRACGEAGGRPPGARRLHGQRLRGHRSPALPARAAGVRLRHLGPARRRCSASTAGACWTGSCPSTARICWSRWPGAIDLITANPPVPAGRRGGGDAEGGLARAPGSPGRRPRTAPPCWPRSSARPRPAWPPGGFLLLETDPAQAAYRPPASADCGLPEVEVVPDLGGRPRVIRGRRP